MWEDLDTTLTLSEVLTLVADRHRRANARWSTGDYASALRHLDRIVPLLRSRYPEARLSPFEHHLVLPPDPGAGEAGAVLRAGRAPRGGRRLLRRGPRPRPRQHRRPPAVFPDPLLADG
eukprot:TRINITY_DN6864_c0_g1_i1.p2 TRINITY_DN6864_c0_g1~~TRINITY_DN6864_c0_g1_i1.p2  ORF type:complete len:119 (-),score=9.46 TRINITY_DN6864_c0_g1_i1:203-559(-)